MPLHPFFSFYGSKWRSVPRLYPSPRHLHIIEPFAGSAGYALRYPHLQVTLNDKDPTIAALWQWLIGVSEADVRALPLIRPGQTVQELGVSLEAASLIGFWINKGVTYPRNRCSAWMVKYLGHSFWGAGVRERVAAQLQHIRHWKVTCSDYSALRDTPATWFVDPPYVLRGRHYKHGSRSIDYAHLAQWCRSRSGQVLVCENVGADWLPFADIGVARSTLRGQYSQEALWMPA